MNGRTIHGMSDEIERLFVHLDLLADAVRNRRLEFTRETEVHAIDLSKLLRRVALVRDVPLKLVLQPSNAKRNIELEQHVSISFGIRIRVVYTLIKILRSSLILSIGSFSSSSTKIRPRRYSSGSDTIGIFKSTSATSSLTPFDGEPFVNNPKRALGFRPPTRDVGFELWPVAFAFPDDLRTAEPSRTRIRLRHRSHHCTSSSSSNLPVPLGPSLASRCRFLPIPLSTNEARFLMADCGFSLLSRSPGRGVVDRDRDRSLPRPLTVNPPIVETGLLFGRSGVPDVEGGATTSRDFAASASISTR